MNKKRGRGGMEEEIKREEGLGKENYRKGLRRKGDGRVREVNKKVRS